MSVSDETPLPESERPLPFDAEACSLLRQAHALIFTRFPEVRSIGTVLDYFGTLNDAQVQKGLWTSDHGPVDTADGIFGSLFQTLRLAEEQFTRAIELAIQLREEVQALTAESVKLRLQNEQSEKAVAAREAKEEELQARAAAEQ